MSFLMGHRLVLHFCLLMLVRLLSLPCTLEAQRLLMFLKCNNNNGNTVVFFQHLQSFFYKIYLPKTDVDFGQLIKPS